MHTWQAQVGSHQHCLYLAQQLQAAWGENAQKGAFTTMNYSLLPVPTHTCNPGRRVLGRMHTGTSNQTFSPGHTHVSTATACTHFAHTDVHRHAHLSPTRTSFSPCCAQCCSSWRMAHIFAVLAVSNSPAGAACHGQGQRGCQAAGIHHTAQPGCALPQKLQC